MCKIFDHIKVLTTAQATEGDLQEEHEEQDFEEGLEVEDGTIETLEEWTEEDLK